MPALYYTQSGRFSIPSLVLALLVGAAVGAALAFVYAYAVLYIPLVYVRIVLTALFAVLLGMFGAAAPLQLGKIRNQNVLKMAVGVLVLLGWYASWVVWVFALLRRGGAPANLVTIASNPDLLWQLVVQINEVGAWRLRGMAVSGVVLWIIWFLEAALILGVGFLLGYVAGKAEPFCENCEQWCQRTEGLARLAGGTDESELKRRLESKDIPYLEQLGAARGQGDAFVQLDLWSCPRCGKTNIIDASVVTVGVDKEGKKLESKRSVLQGLLLTREEAERLGAMGQKLAAASADR